MGVYLWWPIIISDMQWPAPDGFHVPLSSERQAVYNVWTALWGWSSDWTNFGITLKLPFAGYRDTSANVSTQGAIGYYWSSTPYNVSNANYLYFSSTSIRPQNNNYRANGYSARCFKNAPTVPTSSWTKLYWTSIESWGIFWNSALWLISLSSDWTTWITIMDKNLWATTVWNSWDTLSEANCGWYFQWGNNYVFPFTWSVTTSTTKRDTSAYWPWRYYRSSTFITWVADRSRVQNDNLWWWASQWSTTKSVELKNAYIGEVYEYSYIFKWKTATEIWNEWDLLVGSIGVNSEWVTGINSNTEMRIKINIPSLATAKKVIISGTIVWQNSSKTAGQIWIWKWTWWGTWHTCYQVYWSYYNGMKVDLYYNNTDTSWNSVGNATAQTYKPTLTIDLENKTIVWSVSWFSNSTLSLSDAQVADIRTYEYLVCYTSLNTSTISDVSITIE